MADRPLPPGLHKARSPRVEFVRPVHVRIEGKGPVRRLCASNLSRGGMFIRSPQSYPAGTRVTLLLEARGQVLPFAEGQVAWERPLDETGQKRFPGFGVRFTELVPKSRNLVDHILWMVMSSRVDLRTAERAAQAALLPKLTESLPPPLPPPGVGALLTTAKYGLDRSPASSLDPAGRGERLVRAARRVALAAALLLGAGVAALWFARGP